MGKERILVNTNIKKLIQRLECKPVPYTIISTKIQKRSSIRTSIL